MSICVQGSVVMNSPITTDSPFTLGHNCVMFRGNVVATIKGKDIHSMIEIVSSLNGAYRLGYKDGFEAPKCETISK